MKKDDLIAALLCAEMQDVQIYQGPGLPLLRKFAEHGIVEQIEKKVPFGNFGYTTCKGWRLTQKFLNDNFERCSCGIFAAKGQPCSNPDTKRCSTKVIYGKYNRRTKRYE
jgi:hypothetical protein